jgi:hypothetical protein
VICGEDCWDGAANQATAGGAGCRQRTSSAVTVNHHRRPRHGTRQRYFAAARRRRRCDCRRAKPYKWMAEGAKILAKIKRARAALDNAEA